MAAGVHGGTSAQELGERQIRIERFQRDQKYETCIPCDRCNMSIEFRRFNERHEEEVSGLLCMSGGFETDALHTCMFARAGKNGRRKVVYDMQNAPLGFGTDIELPKVKQSKRERDLVYQGGGKEYRRKDGDESAKGSGKIPRTLTN